MQTLILTLHSIVCVLLVILVLLQAGREGMGVIFGGGGGSVFGSGGAGGLLSKMTAFMAVLFLFTCLSYTYITSTPPADESVIFNTPLEQAPADSPAAAPITEQKTAPAPQSEGTATPTAPAAPAKP